MVKTNRLAYWAVILGFFISSLMGQADAADLSRGYVALYGGLTIPESLQHAHGTGPLSSVKLTNLDLVSSPIYGAKLGIRFPGRDRWAGLETEFFYTNPHIKQQNITFSGALPTTTTNFAGAHVRVATWAVNWIVRYPGESFQPYIGVGPGIFWGRMSGPAAELGTGSDSSLGLNALAGTRLLLTQRLALFGEYKYNRVAFDFGGTAALHTLYQAHHFVGGLSLLF
jgi:opacity protein-like surface antigen